jgi:hypothetical protein
MSSQLRRVNFKVRSGQGAGHRPFLDAPLRLMILSAISAQPCILLPLVRSPFFLYTHTMSLPDEMWLLASAHLAQHALLLHRNSLDLDDVDCLPEAFEDGDIEIAMHDSGTTIVELLQMSSDTVTIWDFLAKARGRRGQYNQIVKCHEYFERALSWPDKEFRHEFR